MSKTQCYDSFKALLASALLNGLFLFAILQFYTPFFESNDDFILMHLVDGAYGFNEFRLVYINFLAGWLLKTLYTWFPALAWYTILQYFCLYISFTLICFVIIRRWKMFPAIVSSLCLLTFFGLDAYICIHYTKTASVLTVTGLLLIFIIMEGRARGASPVWSDFLLFTLGFILALFGLMYRNMQFFACGAIICFIIIDIVLIAVEKKNADEKILPLIFRQFYPFILLLSIAIMFCITDKFAYQSEEWSAYIKYNSARTEVMDFGMLPTYGKEEETYKSLDISEEMFDLIQRWDFYDPDIVDEKKFSQLSELSHATKAQENPSLFLRTLDYFFNLLHLWAALPLAVFCFAWLLFGRHDKIAYFAVLFSFICFSILAIYLVSRGRYNIYWVEYGLLFSVCVLIAWFLPRNDEKHILKSPIAILLLSCLLLYLYLPGWNNKFCKAELSKQDGFDTLISQLEQQEKLIIADTYFSELYINLSPFSSEPSLASENILYLGGWQTTYPRINKIFLKNGVCNPYRDCVDNDDVLLLTSHIDLTLSHIQNEYSPDAYAECILHPDEGFGYGLYKILS